MTPRRPIHRPSARRPTPGLAEADPSEDVLGEDARSKLIILAGLAFGVRLRPRDVYVRGIARKGRRTLPEHLPRAAFHACPPEQGLPCTATCGEDDHLATESIFTAADLTAMARLRYVPKLLGGAQRAGSHGNERVVAWVQPVALTEGHPLAGVDGSQNACLLRVESPLSTSEGAQPYDIMVRGPGAGGPETASSVIADIQFCARQLAVAGRLGRPSDGAQRPSPVYTYGATALNRVQDYRGVPSLQAADGLATPFLLRFLHLGGPDRSAAIQTLAQSLRSNGVSADPLDSIDTAPEHLYYRTEPVSIRVMEQALGRVLSQSEAGRLSLDVLYLPILQGTELQDSASS